MWVAASMCLLALAVLWPAAEAPLPDAADTRLIRQVRIVDVARGVAGPPADVLVEGGIITRIGNGLRGPQGVPVLEGGGRFLVPGY